MSFTPFTHLTDLASLKLKFHHEDSDSDLDLSREDDATTQHSMDNTTKSAYGPFHDLNFDSFPESLYERIEDFLDDEGLVFAECSPVLRPRPVKPLIPLKRSSFLDLTPQFSSSLFAETDHKDCGTPNSTLPLFAERRRKSMHAHFKSHFHAENVKLGN